MPLQTGYEHIYLTLADCTSLCLLICLLHIADRKLIVLLATRVHAQATISAILCIDRPVLPAFTGLLCIRQLFGSLVAINLSFHRRVGRSDVPRRSSL